MAHNNRFKCEKNTLPGRVDVLFSINTKGSNNFSEDRKEEWESQNVKWKRQTKKVITQ